MKPEFTIEQIREFASRNYQSISARMVQSLLWHYDTLASDSAFIDITQFEPSESFKNATTCLDCNGTGIYSVGYGNEDWCKTCKGAGYIPGKL